MRLINIKDPLCFKESMSIALEALSNNKYDQLREFVALIPNKVGRISLDTSKEIENRLKRCINDFKVTKSYFWLREDFKNSLYDIEIQVNKKIS